MRREIFDGKGTDMLQERNFPTFLTKLTPAPKLWFALGLILANILLKNLYFSIAVIIVSVVMIIKEKHMGLFKLRAIPLMCALFLIFLSIDMTDLGVTMCKAGISYNFVFTFVDSFQVITLLRKDMEQIRDAQRARGLNTEGNLLQRFKAFIPIIVPVVANSIIKVQDQAVAMDTKGFNSSCKKTVYRELTPYKWDAACKWLGIFLGVFAVLYRILAAVQVIPAFLTNII